MARLDSISSAFWLVFGLLVSLESYRLGLGSLHQPGPGFLYFWTGVFLMILSLGILARARSGLGAAPSHGSVSPKANKGKVLAVLLSLFLYAVLLEAIGFVILTFLLFLFLLRVLERKGWVLSTLTSAAVTLASYVVFDILLESQLPKGLLALLRL